MRCSSTTARSAAGARHECVSRRFCRISLTRTHPEVRQCERMGGRPRRCKGIFSFDAKDGSCAVMCAACERGALVEPLALMKSADQLPIRQTRLDPPFALRGFPFPGARPVLHHLPRTFPAPGGLSPSGTRLGRRRRCGGTRPISFAKRQNGPKDARRFGGHGHGDDEPWAALDHCGAPRRGLGGHGESVSQHRQLTH
jgi:hypothetical protein